MEKDDAGQLKFSFANLLSYHSPLVLLDEAHNAKSDLSLEVLTRVNAACVIEFTATPADNSNKIVSISATELKDEEMIKLPINFGILDTWQEAVVASIQMRAKLEEIALTDEKYIRPLVLFQAEDKGKEITVEVLKANLLENDIPLEQIAIATGEQRELDKINLFDPNCPIRFVITVQALKEGWDCSFAYVLCSLANTASTTSVEQLLGRVLRMPYAKSRKSDALNRAYAYVCKTGWTNALSKLTERLVNMGFEKAEVKEVIYEQTSLSDFEEQTPSLFQVTLSQPLDLSSFSEAEQSLISVSVQEGGYVLSVNSDLTPQILAKITPLIADKAERREAEIRGEIVIARAEALATPSQKGIRFTIPQLCFIFDDGVELAESETALGEKGWDLLSYSSVITKQEFSTDETGEFYQIDIEKGLLKPRFESDAVQLDFSNIRTEMSDLGLVIWLDRKLYSIDLKQEVLLAWLRLVIAKLLARGDLDLPKLIRGKYILEKLLREKIKSYRQSAVKAVFHKDLFGEVTTVSPQDFSFAFAKQYPISDEYEGFKFNKHFYPRVGIMNKEEVECAKALDKNPNIAFWVRNLERQERFSFWLPTSTDKFYPDFVAQLNDGRTFVVEYKGGHLENADTDEKELVGRVWAQKSGNLFLMAWKENNGNLSQQIERALG